MRPRSMGRDVYCNRDGTVRYAADIIHVRRRQKCYKTTELTDMPVRKVTGDEELTRRRSLVRTSIAQLEKAAFCR